MKKICVIGYPAKHSLSPYIHKYWLDKYGIEGSYEIQEIAPDKFDNFFLNLHKNDYAGCNITVPYKERAFELVDGMDEDYRDVDGVAFSNKAINTILVTNKKYIALNTDSDGFIKNIEKHKSIFRNKAAVVLGAGGAARSIVLALVILQCKEIIIANRNIDKAKKIVDDLGLYIKYMNPLMEIKITAWEERNSAISGANLLVNTTSLGMVGQPELDIDLTNLPKNALVTDIVYRPLETKLLKDAKSRGNPTVDGLGMLLYQAKPGFEMWFADELKAKNIDGVEVTQELRAKIEALL